MSMKRSKGPSRTDERPPRPGARRVPPPETTGMEARYLLAQGRSGRPVRLRLRDGNAIEGIVREFDREILTVEPDVGDPVTIRKSEIRYLEEL
jgi:hypothetical protein